MFILIHFFEQMISHQVQDVLRLIIAWSEPTVLSTYNDKNKNGLQQNLLIQESLKIRRLKTSRGKGRNNPQLSVRSNAWDPILAEI